MSREIKSATQPGISYDGTWDSITFNTALRSHIGLHLKIVQGSATSVTFKVQSLVDSTWYDVYDVSSGTGSLDEVATTISGDADIVFPMSVENYENCRVRLKVNNATGCTVAAYLTDMYVQKVSPGHFRDGAETL